ncbi:MAG: preprotein translocase subunit SecE [Paludibacteraceae bacterium]|nr:preprotein translocase subunit SecE [Paludibacteraceae bacterium]
MKIVEYVKDSYNELVHKVSWPTAKDLTNSSVIVLIASLVLALVVWLMDLGFENLLTWIYKLLASL